MTDLSPTSDTTTTSAIVRSMTDLSPTSDTTTTSAILMHYNGNLSAAQCTSLSTVPLRLDEASLPASSTDPPPAFLTSTTAANNHKRKRRPAGTPDPDAEVVALSPKTLMESNRYVCEICNQGFQRDQNLQMHRRRHRVPWKLAKRLASCPDHQVRKRVYVCPEPTCLHHDASHALGDLVGIKKHYRRKHNCMKQWECEKCCKAYAVQSDYKAHLKTCGTRGHCCDCGRVFSRVESFIEHQDTCAARSGRMMAVAAPYAAGSLPSLNDTYTQKSVTPIPSADTVNDYHHDVIMNARSLAAGRDGAAPSPRRSTACAARFVHESPPPLPSPAAPTPPPPTAAPAGSWAAHLQLIAISEGERRGAEIQFLPTKHRLHMESSQSSVTLRKDMMSVISSASCSPSKTEERTAQKNSAPPKLQLSVGLYAEESSCDTSTPSMSRPSEGKDSCLMPDSERKAWLEWRPMDCSLQLPALLTDDASVPILAMATLAKRCSVASANKHASAVGCASTNLELATSTWVNINPALQRNGAELVSDQTKLCNGRGSTSEWRLVDTSISSSPQMLQEFQDTSMKVSTSALMDSAVQQQQRLLAAAVEAPCHESKQSKIPGHMKLLLGRCKSAAELLMQDAGEKLKQATAEKLQAEGAWQEAKRERELAEAELESAHRVRENAYSQLLLLKAAAFHHISPSSPSSSSNSHASSYSQLHRYNSGLVTCPTCHQQTAGIVHPGAYNKAAPLFSDTGAGGYTESPPITTTNKRS